MFAPFGHQAPLICAHRGDTTDAPENTRASYAATAALGGQMCEIDLRLTADGVAVVIHDHSLARTGGRDQIVHRSRWADIRDADVGGWYDPRFRGEPLLRFEDALGLFRDLRLGMMIELKDLYGRPGLLEQKAVAAILDAGMQDNVLLSSFDHLRLRMAQQLAEAAGAHIRTIGLLHNRYGNFVEIARSTNLDFVSLEFYVFDRADAAVLSDAGIGVACYVPPLADFGTETDARLAALREAISAREIRILTCDDVAWARAFLAGEPSPTANAKHDGNRPSIHPHSAGDT